MARAQNKWLDHRGPKALPAPQATVRFNASLLWVAGKSHRQEESRAAGCAGDAAMKLPPGLSPEFLFRTRGPRGQAEDGAEMSHEAPPGWAVPAGAGPAASANHGPGPRWRAA